jgi:hypothetical protein
MKNVYLAISQGNVYRDLVRLGTLRHLVETRSDVRLVVLTQGWAVREIQEELRHERIVLARHDMYGQNRWQSYLTTVRTKLRSRTAIDAVLRLEASLAKEPAGIEECLRSYPPALVVSTHPRMVWEWDLVSWARRSDIPTLGIVKSWDNILRHLHARTDRIAVWGRANRRDAMEVEGYRSDEIEVTGAASFDPYFDPAVLRPRVEFLRSVGLDPELPVVLFGTAGGIGGDWDETFLMDELLELRRTEREFRDLQIICRLHPISHLSHFWPYRKEPGVVLSFGSYVKTLGWCMTRAEVEEMANLLAHADVVVTPASTLSIEGAIFDTPVIVTLYSTVRPDLHDHAIQRHWLDMHFRPIAEKDWIPFARSPEDLAAMIRTAIHDRAWYRDQRKALVDEYVTLTDGRAYQRIADLIYSSCR